LDLAGVQPCRAACEIAMRVAGIGVDRGGEVGDGAVGVALVVPGDAAIAEGDGAPARRDALGLDDCRRPLDQRVPICRRLAPWNPRLRLKGNVGTGRLSLPFSFPRADLSLQRALREGMSFSCER